MTDQRAAAPTLSRNPISVAGAALTTVSAVAFLIFFALELFDLLRSPYTGLIAFLVIPLFFVVGLLLIPFGMWREGRRRQRGHAPWSWPAINLNTPRTRFTIAIVLLLTLVNVGIVVVASVKVVHYTESNQFCGLVCHTPMKPEFTAHQSSPHASVDCVGCHVGPGAQGFIRAKMNGTRQLYLVMNGHYSRPIPEPLDRLPRAVETCAGCHTAGRPDRDITKVVPGYADDAANTESLTTLTLNMKANHWHARPDANVEYVAADAGRQTIPYVRVTDAAGKVTEYFADGVTARPAGPLHRMDCLDCHNRPAHTFSPTVDRAVDTLVYAGGVNKAIPFVRKELVAALKTEYPTEAAAMAGIDAQLSTALHPGAGATDADVRAAIAAAQQLYRTNVFPEMKVTWGTYMSNLGHVDSPGCFRCHDDSHKTKNGGPVPAIRQDCEVCHKVQ